MWTKNRLQNQFLINSIFAYKWLKSRQQKIAGQTGGFTLVELLVVISIIGVLAGLLLPNFVGIRGRAQDAKTKSDLKQLKTALRLYYNDFQRYPDSANGNTQIAGCGVGGDTACSTTFSAGSGPTVYFKDMPTDFWYYTDVAASGNSFLLRAELENASDEDIATSQARCVPAGHPYSYVDMPSPQDYFVCED